MILSLGEEKNSFPGKIREVNDMSKRIFLIFVLLLCSIIVLSCGKILPPGDETSLIDYESHVNPLGEEPIKGYNEIKSNNEVSHVVLCTNDLIEKDNTFEFEQDESLLEWRNPVSYDNPIDSYFRPFYRKVDSQSAYTEVVRNHYYAWQDELYSVLDYCYSKFEYSCDRENVERLELMLPLFENALTSVMRTSAIPVDDGELGEHRHPWSDMRLGMVDYYRFLCQTLISYSDGYEYQDKIYEFRE